MWGFWSSEVKFGESGPKMCQMKPFLCLLDFCLHAKFKYSEAVFSVHL